MRTARPTRTSTAVAAATLGLVLTACAGDGDGDAAASATTAADETATAAASTDDQMTSTDDQMTSMEDDQMTSTDDDQMASMDDEMDMGSADGPRADEADADRLRQGDLLRLDGAPATFEDASGTAYLALDPMTWVTVDVEGLVAGTEVVGHLHAESCATSGGPHFQFDPAGGDMPPNEVHVSGTAADDGSLSVSVTNEMVADDAVALVLHAADGDTTKALCADLPPAQ